MILRVLFVCVSEITNHSITSGMLSIVGERERARCDDQMLM